MSSEKSLAIVIRLVDFSETSCVVTLFTEDFGKISALAKGGRRPKGPFESALDLLALCRIVFIHKLSDALDLLTEAKLERRFRAASRDLSRLYAGYYVAELLNELTDENDSHPNLFHTANSALSFLDSDKDVATTVLHFELQALHVLGHFPSLTHCVVCGSQVDVKKRVAFGQQDGGVLCQNCKSGRRQVISMSQGALETMRALVALGKSHPFVDLVPGSHGGELRAIMNQYITNLLGRRPRMYDFLSALAVHSPSTENSPTGHSSC